MKLAILFSGGKDSTFTLYYYLQQAWDVECLITLKSINESSYMFHTPNIDLVQVQSKALGIPLIEQETAGEKEKELLDLKKAFSRAKTEFKIDGVAVGALLSDYQAERVNRICEELQLKCYTPLWHKNQEMLLREMIANGFEIIIQSIAGEGLSKRWLGRKIDEAAIDELVVLQQKFGLHPAGEGGEYESLVIDGPMFLQRLVIEKSSVLMENECTGKLVIENVKLEKKE